MVNGLSQPSTVLKTPYYQISNDSMLHIVLTKSDATVFRTYVASLKYNSLQYYKQKEYSNTLLQKIDLLQQDKSTLKAQLEMSDQALKSSQNLQKVLDKECKKKKRKAFWNGTKVGVIAGSVIVGALWIMSK